MEIKCLIKYFAVYLYSTYLESIFFILLLIVDKFCFRSRYSETLKACTLDVDISLMVGGDMAYIGEKGVNLSGGQRARLALARFCHHFVLLIFNLVY